jgi:amino acid adenylation domain-containing protein
MSKEAGGNVKFDDQAEAAAGASAPAPDAVLSQYIIALWRELLRVPAVDMDDNVFAMGADSLSVLIFITRLRAFAGDALNAVSVYALPSPRQQVQALSSQFGVAASAAGEAALQEDVELPRSIPLGEGQMEKWFVCQFGEEASLAFNDSSLLRLDGVLDAARLKGALQTAWHRHDALHSGFAADGSRVHFNTDIPLPFEELDLSAPADQTDQVELRLEAFCRQQARQPFDLSIAPLVRFTLIRLDERRHALHVLAHQLVMDGWSLAVFVDELGACYNAAIHGHESALAAADSFRRHLLDECARRADGATAISLDYWQKIYATPPSTLRLPADRPASVAPDYAAATERHAFTPGLTEALRNEVRRRGVSLYSLLLSGFGVLLAKLSGQDDFAVAVPFAGLAIAGKLPLIGDGVDVLPLRMQVGAELSFGELARRTHTALLDAAEHRHATLTGIQRMLGLRASGGEAALTGVAFTLRPRMRGTAFEGLHAELESCPRSALDWDLYFDFDDSGDQLRLDLHYATARYDAATMRRWITFFETLLCTVSGCDGCNDVIDMAVGDIDLLNAAGRAEVLYAWNDTARAYDRNQSLNDLIEAQMRQTPARIAAECEGAQMDYAALDQATHALAQALRRRGIGRGDIVGVSVPRSLGMLVAVLGILRSGAAYVPLDPKFPDARLKHMADHSRLRYVLMSRTEQVSAAVAAGRELLEVAELCSEAGDTATLPEVRGDDLAYVLFTSGSTGEPKGVRILHRNLVNFLLSMREEPGFGPDDVLCGVTTLSFDIAGLELYLPLITGGRLVIATEVLNNQPMALFDLMRRSGCTVLQTTPSLLQLLQGIGREEAVRQLRLFVGGEALPLSLAHAMAADCREFWNLYGPTETTIWSTVARIHSDTRVIPLGKPIANTRVYVLDARGHPVAPGVIGEIWIGGDGVSDGYLFRPELTAERFVADPFANGDARMYRTGDLGSWREGLLYFHGRADSQIKIRGYRIEPGDIEAAAASDPRVQECVAVARRFGENDLRLVLYVVRSGDDQGFVDQLRSVLRSRLPEYMRPQHIECLAALPKTPNGKIDRNALPPPAAALAQVETEGDQHASTAMTVLDDPRQEYLAGIWRELVGVRNVRGIDNFFDIGGHSLLAVEFATRVHRETGVWLNLLSVATGTLASLAVELPEANSASAQKDLPLGSRLRRLLGFDNKRD